jgi:hypothetical protein
MKRIIFASLFILMALTNCAKKYTIFTYDIVKKYDIKENDFRKVQFYSSEEISLTKKTIEEKEINLATKTRGVVVKQHTCGVCIRSLNDTLFVSFDKNDKTGIPFVKKGKEYYIGVTKNNQIKLTNQAIGSNQYYDVLNGENAQLLFVENFSEFVELKSHIATGLKLQITK